MTAAEALPPYVDPGAAIREAEALGGEAFDLRKKSTVDIAAQHARRFDDRDTRDMHREALVNRLGAAGRKMEADKRARDGANAEEAFALTKSMPADPELREALLDRWFGRPDGFDLVLASKNVRRMQSREARERALEILKSEAEKRTPTEEQVEERRREAALRARDTQLDQMAEKHLAGWRRRLDKDLKTKSLAERQQSVALSIADAMEEFDELAERYAAGLSSKADRRVMEMAERILLDRWDHRARFRREYTEYRKQRKATRAAKQAREARGETFGRDETILPENGPEMIPLRSLSRKNTQARAALAAGKLHGGV